MKIQATTPMAHEKNAEFVDLSFIFNVRTDVDLVERFPTSI